MKKDKKVRDEETKAEDKLETSFSKKKKKKEKDYDVSIDDNVLKEDDSKSKKRKKDKTSESEAISNVEENAPPKKKKKKKKKELDLIEDDKEEESKKNDDDVSEVKKKKKKKKKIDPIEDDKEEAVKKNNDNLSMEKKIKHKKSDDPSSLGMVDSSILRQAGTNLGLDVVPGSIKPVESSDKTENEEEQQNKKSKKKKKDKKAKNLNPNDSTSEPVPSRFERCLSYLQLWNSSREQWSFKKASQIHLLSIMYDQVKMDDDNFAIMLRYLADMKGKGRDKTKEDAEKFMQETEGETAEVRADRARQVLQMLS